MPEQQKIRYDWLKAIYIYTIVGAGGFGLGIIVIPTYMRNAILHVVIFLSYIIGNLIAIPFSYVFGREAEAVPERIAVCGAMTI